MSLPVRLLFALALLAGNVLAQTPANPNEQTRLLRFPATNGRQIVFSYAGQLYTVGMEGGTARRMTDGPGWAVFPHFSADGSQLAFTAQYDGNTEVYVMPADGGVPRRLSYTATLSRDDLSDRMGPNNIVMAWKNKSNEIAFRSRWRDPNDFLGQLYTVGLDGDIPQQLPVPRGGFLSFSPDDSKMAYNRVFREFRTWKRYKGGMADDVWIIDLKTGALENITNNDAQDIMPMWAPDGRIFFASDRDGKLNLYSYDSRTKQTTQHTTFKDFDVKFPSLGNGGIVFEQAGMIWHFDLKTGKTRQVPVTVREDFAIARGGLVNVTKFVSSALPAPDGKRVVAVARGEVFTVPAKHGAVRNLTNSPGVHERNASWSPDGKWIAYIGDSTGENEIWLRPQDGRGEAVQVTKNADTYYFTPVWSPDSKKILWGDREQRLRFVDIDSKEVTLIEENEAFSIANYNWAPDSKWVTWTSPQRDSYPKVRIYSLESKQSTDVTDGWFTVSNARFSDDGKWLLFASGRDFSPTYGVTEFNHIYRNWERVYMVALAKDVESPFKPKSDEVEIAKDEKKSDDRKPDEKKADEKAESKEEKSVADTEKKNGDDKSKPQNPKPRIVVKVDLDGLQDRVVGLPVAAANYSAIDMAGDKVYYVKQTDGRPGSTLMLYSLKDLKETELGTVTSYAITSDRKKMLIRSGADSGIIDLPTAKFELKDKISFANLEMKLDPVAEWNQIYHESWRQMRDYFYAKNMHGVDWPAMRERYATLLPHVRHRNDLSYIIGELIAELNAGHAYVGGGERANEAPRVQTGLLGAEFSRDPQSRAFRIDRILRGQNWNNTVRSPLTEIGVNVNAGDYILAVNGVPAKDLPNLHAALVGKVGDQVTLRVNSKPTDEGSREVVVVPIADEHPLYYYNWVQKNIDYVTKKTGGRVGYIHIPDMGPEGLNEFVKHFYPQLTKKALIIDDRGNGGGNVSPQIIERLRRELVGISMRRDGPPTPSPASTFVGPMVMLINEFSASDGDLVAHRFRSHKLGTLIGKRTWGGVVGISGSLPFVDGGTLNKPEFHSMYSPDGKQWQIEGEGVTPDIVVDNDPWKEFHGEDQQLDRAIAHILEELKTKGRDLPPPPPLPIKK